MLNTAGFVDDFAFLWRGVDGPESSTMHTRLTSRTFKAIYSYYIVKDQVVITLTQARNQL